MEPKTPLPNVHVAWKRFTLATLSNAKNVKRLTVDFASMLIRSITRFSLFSPQGAGEHGPTPCQTCIPDRTPYSLVALPDLPSYAPCQFVALLPFDICELEENRRLKRVLNEIWGGEKTQGDRPHRLFPFRMVEVRTEATNVEFRNFLVKVASGDHAS